MAMIWSDTYEDLTKESMNKLIDGFAAGNPPKPGSQIGRQFAAPEGGARVMKDGGAPTYTKLVDAPKEPTK
jgi:NADH-quinone oxidoreductase subunit E